VRSVIATRLLARDGGIVLPSGILTKFFEQNPVVLARHAQNEDSSSPVIGRSLGLLANERGMESVTQFADTELGREYAYLYGVNPMKEVFMRAWSFGWRTLAQEWWTRERAQQFLGADWDEETAAGLEQVWVAVQSEMHEYSAVPVGADRAALSRAFGAGVRTAGQLIVGLDLAEAQREIAQLKFIQGETSQRFAKLEAQLQAQISHGAAAADPGDSAEVLAAIRELTALARDINQNKRQ
jgi:hypothetical protein